MIGAEEQCARTSHNLKTKFVKYLEAVKTLGFLRALMCALYVLRPAESTPVHPEGRHGTDGREGTRVVAARQH